MSSRHRVAVYFGVGDDPEVVRELEEGPREWWQLLALAIVALVAVAVVVVLAVTVVGFVGTTR